MGFLTWNPWMHLTICKPLILYAEVRPCVHFQERVDLILRGPSLRNTEPLPYKFVERVKTYVHFSYIKNYPNNLDNINNLED